MVRSADALEWRIEGSDQVGFLARLLRRRIGDCFVLRGPAGGPPDEGDRQALESLLESLTADS